MLAVAGLLAAAPALADQTITAGPVPNQYASTSVTMDQGEAVTFQNSDTSGAKHDVRSDKFGSDGKTPLFKSDLTDQGKTNPVDGVQYLTTGDYAFHCSIHPFMMGTLHVTGNGTPKTRPAPDTTPPTATVAIVDARIRTILKRGAIRVAVRSDEPARFKLTALAGRTTIADATVVLKGTTRNADIKLTAAGRKLLQKASSATIKLKAVVNDTADNKSAATATRKLKS
jgi:plastocyanin